LNWIKIHSIRKKLLLVFSAIMLLMFGLLFILNQLFLDDYFLYVNERTMIKSTARYHSSSQLKPIDYREVIGRLSMLNGARIFIYNEDGTLDMGDLSKDSKSTRDSQYISSFLKEADKNREEGSLIVLPDDVENTKQMVYIRSAYDGKYIVISKGLGLIDESQEVFVLFLGISSIVIYLVGFILIYIYADQFTRPIIHLKIAAEEMAALNFQESIEVTSDDEIGQLVQSVNGMARALSNSIEELNASNALLERELNKERSLENMRRRFVTDVSHELKNPISMIIGYADGIERGVAKTKEDRIFYAQVIQEEGNRMNRLVRDLLDISSYTSGTFKMTETDVDLAKLLRSTMNKYQKVVDELEVTLAIKGLSSAVVRGDAARLEQVLTNLLDNALKHVDKQGLVVVYVDKIGPKTKLVIANTGDLIPRAELDAIWESFYQVDTASEGNGLGLTIVKSIIDMHKATIKVYVSEGMNHFEIIL